VETGYLNIFKTILQYISRPVATGVLGTVPHKYFYAPHNVLYPEKICSKHKIKT